MAFWVDWELWEKMCFVLGCLIVIVLAYGASVQIYNTWRTKKVAAAELHAKTQQELTAGMQLFAQDDVPFGSRAIESGIEVDGIWISNRNTPQSSPQPQGTPEVTRPSSPRFGQLHTLDAHSVSLDDSQTPQDTHVNPNLGQLGDGLPLALHDSKESPNCCHTRQTL